MDEVSERELEQQKRLELFGKRILLILKDQRWMFVLAFLLFLLGCISLMYDLTSTSSYRYVARLSLHYYPKYAGKIEPYDEKFMLNILNSPTLRRRFINTLKDKGFDNVHPTTPFQFKVEKQRHGSFMIVLTANSEREAVTMTNAYASLCIQEYANIRSVDLQNFKSVMLQKKQDVFDQVQAMLNKKEELVTPLRSLSPDHDLDRLRAELSHHRDAQEKLQLVNKNLEAKVKRLSAEMERINPNLLSHHKEIRELVAEIKTVDKELYKARELFTEKNPKLISLVSRKEALSNKLEDFLKISDISQSDLGELDSMDKLSSDLEKAQVELESSSEELSVLEGEIAEKQTLVDKLTQVLPEYKELNLRASGLLESLKSIDESIANVDYMLLLVKDDLFITEKVVSAVGKSPFRKKYMAVAAFLALSLTGLIAVFIAFVEYMLGKVASEQEMRLFPEMRYLGMLPVPKDDTGLEIYGSPVLDLVARYLQSSDNGEMHIVFASSLPGASIAEGFFAAIDWNYAMAGKKTLCVDIMSVEEAGEDVMPMENSCILSTYDNRTILPITSLKHILPPEMEMLKKDMVVLREKYDLIFFRGRFSLRTDRLLLEQLTVLCDAMLLGAHLMRTPRRALRALSSFQRETETHVMTLLFKSPSSRYVDEKDEGKKS